MPAYTQPSSMGLTPPTPSFGRPQDAGYSRETTSPVGMDAATRGLARGFAEPAAPTPSFGRPQDAGYSRPAASLAPTRVTDPSTVPGGRMPVDPVAPEPPRQGFLSGFLQNANAQTRGLGFDIAPNALSDAADRNEELRNLVNDTQAGAMRSNVDTQREIAAREARKFDYGMAGLRAPAASQRVLDAARQRGASAQQLSNIQTEADRIQQRLLSAGRGGGQGFNEGGQVRGYQDGGMPQRVMPFDTSRQPDNDTPSFDVDPEKLRSGEPGAFTFNGQIATPGDGSGAERAAQNRQALGNFFRNLPGNVANAASSAAAYAADPSNYMPSAEQRAANIAANEERAAAARAVNQNLYNSFGQAASNVAGLASSAADFKGAQLAGLAQIPGTMAENAATLYHRMEGGAERDAYDAGYQAGYKAGLSASGKMSSQPGGRGAASVESGTYGRGTVAGPTADQIRYTPMSSYTLRSANAARLGNTSANLTGAAATRGAAPVASGRGTVAGPTAAQLRAANDPFPSQPASPMNNDPIPSQPGVAPFMDPIPSQPGVAPKRYADPIPGAPDLVPTPQSYLSGLSAPLEDFPSETFSLKRRSPADAPPRVQTQTAPVQAQTEQERQSVQDRIAELKAQLGITDTNTTAPTSNILDRANNQFDLLLGGN